MDTTNKAIINAGVEYTMNTRPVCIGGAAFEEQMREFNRNYAFEAGADGCWRGLVSGSKVI